MRGDAVIKDIIVNLSSGEGGHPAGDYAISVASALEAHIAGIAFVYEVLVPMGRMGYAPAELVALHSNYDSLEVAG